MEKAAVSGGPDRMPNRAEQSALMRAHALLTENAYTCALCKGGAALCSALRGVSPLLEWIDAGVDLSGYCMADKVVGKAAALLAVYAGIRAVYAPVMSETAVAVFCANGVPFICDERVQTIANRTKTGICPMEQAVANIDDPSAALEAVRRTRAELTRAGRA